MARKLAWGIDVGESAIKAVLMRRVGDDAVVVDYRTVPCEAPSGEAGMGDHDFRVRGALATLLSEIRLKGATVAVSMPGHDVFPRFIPLPPVDKKRIPEVVRYEARTQMPFPIEEVVWDYQPVTGMDVPGEDIEVALFAIKKTAVYAFLTNLRLAGLVPDLVEIAPLALYNFIYYDREPETGTVVIDVGAANTDLVVIDGERFWTRNVSISGHDITRALQEKYQISFEEAEALKLKASTSKQAEKLFGAMRPIVDDLLGEIQRSIGYYKAQNRNVRIEDILLLGNSFKLKGLVDYFRENLDYKVAVLNDLNRLQMASASHLERFEAELPNYGVALGLALQALGLGRIEIDMRPAELVRDRILKAKLPFAAAAAALLAIPPALWFRSASARSARFEAESGPLKVEIGRYNAKLSEIKKAQDLGPLAQRLEEVARVGQGRLDWLLFLDGLNKALNELPREKFLLASVADVTERPAQTGPLPPAAIRAQLRKQQQTKGPRPLKVEVKFWKATNFSPDDVTQLKALLAKQPNFRAVEGQKEERATDVFGSGRPRGRVTDTAGRGFLYSFWVTFSTKPLPEEAPQNAASATTRTSRRPTRRTRRK